MRDENSAPVPTGAEGPATREHAVPRRDRPLARETPRGLPVRRSYAALDLGTNNCRLLIAEPAREGFRVVDAFSRIVRLGEGLGTTDRLSEDAIVRTLDALGVCAGKMRARGVARARVIATEACRLAQNGPAFIARARAETGLDLEVVDRRTEAFLAVTGCAALADPRAGGVMVFDIGGGSTEIAWLERRNGSFIGDPARIVRAWDSLPVGVVTLAERHGGTDVTRASFAGMVAEVTGLITPFAHAAAAAPAAPNFHLLGTSGTVTTLAARHLRLPRYDRRRVDGLWMQDAEVTDAVDALLETRIDERARDPNIGQGRADLVLAGCAILEAIRRAFPATRLRIADRGLREGLLMNMMREDGVWRRHGR